MGWVGVGVRARVARLGPPAAERLVRVGLRLELGLGLG